MRGALFAGLLLLAACRDERVERLQAEVAKLACVRCTSSFRPAC